MSLHTDFHARFLRAIDQWRDRDPPEAIGGFAVPAFAVYANTGLRACIDALLAAYPSVVHTLGEAAFQPLAAQFARACPPKDPRMFLYGKGFADHLRAVAPPGRVALAGRPGAHRPLQDRSPCSRRHPPADVR